MQNNELRDAKSNQISDKKAGASIYSGTDSTSLHFMSKLTSVDPASTLK